MKCHHYTNYKEMQYFPKIISFATQKKKKVITINFVAYSLWILAFISISIRIHTDDKQNILKDLPTGLLNM